MKPSFDHTEFAQARYYKPMEMDREVYRRLKVILHMLPPKGNLLELGCWDGSTIAYYRQRFHGKTHGLDITPDILSLAKDRIDEIKVCNLETDTIPWPTDYFDVVICGEVIEHIFDTDRLLTQIIRVLKPGGMLVLSTPNLGSFFNRFFLLAGLQPIGTEVSIDNSRYGNPLRRGLKPSGHIRVFTHGALMDILKANGFEILCSKGVALSRNRLMAIVEKITASIHPSLGSDIVVKCRKPLTGA